MAEEEGAVHVRDVDIFNFVKLVKDSPIVLSLGMLCEEMGFTFSWEAGEQPSLTPNGVTIECRSHNQVPIIAVTKPKKNPCAC